MSLFSTPALAAGYARSRPPVHAHVIRRISAWLGQRVERAIDIGCGAGLSTLPLAEVAALCVGIEPEIAMLRFAAMVAPRAGFVNGQAERLPFASRAANLMTAAGSLNYVDFDAFFSEAGRVLAPEGSLFVYDFSAGRSFPDSSALDDWWRVFLLRYPMPDDARPVSPESLAVDQRTFSVQRSEHFHVDLPFDCDRYREYMLSETNVAQAVRQGEPEAVIRQWCSDTLEPVFSRGVRVVRFAAYLAQLGRVA